MEQIKTTRKKPTETKPKVSQYKGTKKEIKVVRSPNGLFFAKFDGGGELPAVLAGMWTNENELMGRIQRYKESK